MFDQSFSTSFGVTVNVLPSTLLHLPAVKSCSVARAIGASPVVQLHVSEEMESRYQRLSGSHVRLGSLQGEVCRIGVAISYVEGHFALGLFDHGDAQVKEMSQAALRVERFHLLFRSGGERTLVSVPLTANMRQFLTEGKLVPPCTVADYFGAASSTVKSLTQRGLYAEMGIDADTLKSVTVSVCLPNSADHSDLEVVKASALN